MKYTGNQIHTLQLLIILTWISCSVACNKKDQPVNDSIYKTHEIVGADMSFLPEIRKSGIPIYNRENKQEDMLLTLKKAGVNVIRLRIWNGTLDSNSTFETVNAMAKELHQMGFKLLLSVHYSDTWADPSKQSKPNNWNNTNYSGLKDSIYAYTKKIISIIQPDYIQIGNEINSGLLWPEGHISNPAQMKELLGIGIKAVRENNPSTKIIIHYAGFTNANQFYALINELDYDIIGLSYYPIWHGKNLEALKIGLTNLATTFNKNILITETSYPFTFEWNDFTNNIIGSSDQILQDYPATAKGQKAYLQHLSAIVKEVDHGIGFCYWGGEWVSYKGSQATNGSSYENQALWDFNNKALEAMDAFH